MEGQQYFHLVVHLQSQIGPLNGLLYPTCPDKWVLTTVLCRLAVAAIAPITIIPLLLDQTIWLATSAQEAKILLRGYSLITERSTATSIR